MKAFETERLRLRPWTLDDIEDLYEYAKSDKVGPNAGWAPHKSIEESKNIIKMFIENNDVHCIELKESGKVIGGLGIHDYETTDEQYSGKIMKEIGFVLNPDYWGNGYVPEAAMEAIEFSFNELDVDILWCCHYDFNVNSQKVINKCGFEFVYKTNKVLERLDNREVVALYYNIVNPNK